MMGGAPKSGKQRTVGAGVLQGRWLQSKAQCAELGSPKGPGEIMGLAKPDKTFDRWYKWGFTLTFYL